MHFFRRQIVEVTDLNIIVGVVYRHLQNGKPLDPLMAYRVAVDLVTQDVYRFAAMMMIDHDIIEQFIVLKGLTEQANNLLRYLNLIKYLAYATMGMMIAWLCHFFF